MLKLGTETGSLVNHVYSHTGNLKPEIGMGVTMLFWSDRHAGTIVEMFKIGKRVALKVQADKVRRIDTNGMSESQSYECSRDPAGAVAWYRANVNGGWQKVVFNPVTMRWSKDGGGLIVGWRDAYHDYSF